MKITYNIVALLCIAAALASSCRKESMLAGISVEGLAGKWAAADSSQMVDRYISFDDGRFETYLSQDGLAFAGGEIWHCTEAGFTKTFSEKYSFSRGHLISESCDYGAICVNGDSLTLGKERYHRVKNFNPLYYSHIDKERGTLEIGRDQHECAVRISLVRPVAAYRQITASSENEWIQNIHIEPGDPATVHFSVDENNSGNDRKGIVTLGYATAKESGIIVSQYKNVSHISVDTDWEREFCDESLEIPYSISDIIPTEQLSAKLECSWARVVSVTGGQEGIVTLELDRNTAKDERKAVMTLSYPNAESVEVNLTQFGGIDLKDKKANCFLIGEPGAYSIDCSVKGNGNPSLGDVDLKGKIVSAALTDGNPVVNILECKNDRISFRIPEDAASGNAIVEGRDKGGKTLWSWHIWYYKDFDAEATADTYNNGSKVMSCNLGATASDWTKEASCGLLYQWGRKDPFFWDGKRNSVSTSDISTGECIMYSIEHPRTFIRNLLRSSYDWLNDRSNPKLWNKDKTIYDPCPAGWRVPDKALWVESYDKSSKSATDLTGNVYSRTFPKGALAKDKEVHLSWFGFLYYDTAEKSKGSIYFWTVDSHNSELSFGYSFGISSGVVFPDNMSPKAEGTAVRCVKISY